MSATKPEVTVPAGNPPEDLVIEDVIVGTGNEAKAGANVEVHYVGVAWSTQREFDASWNRGDSFEFRLGAGQVIAGWDGRRVLTIPPAMGYGAQGAGGVIKGGETLIFVVDLLNVN
jgi:peptidylprolyl isomerase